ncbi:MAG: RagB/SusD family nutrient uptake outer membrane protein, partial [Chryseolinea sp.]
KQILKITGSFLAVILIFAQCNDNLLESTSYGQVTSQQFWRNGDDVVSAVNAIYEPLLQENYFGHFERTWDIQSDDMWRAGDHAEDQSIEYFTYDASNPKLIDTWKWRYEMISRANAVLINAPDVTMDTELKNRSLGEAHFLRGFSYWRHYLVHGEVPIFVEADVLAGNLNKTKATLAEVEAQIESDFLKAAELLPESYQADPNNLGRVTQGTAYGFLTKFYVYTEQFQKAIDAGEHITQNATYALAPSFEDNFTIDTENNSEILFSMQYTSNWTTDNTPQIYTTPRPWGGWDFREPIQDLVDEFEPTDPRLGYTVLQVGDMVDLGGDAGVQEYTADLSTSGFHFRKFASWKDGGLNSDQNAPILRSADVYLLVAEAKIRSSQNGDAELDAVRTRNSLSPITNATMDDIMHERRVELAGENERQQDLLRWDKADLVNIVDFYNQDRGALKPARTFQRPKHYYFPIPQREIDISNGVLIQNENY